jgi:hypothetical protein
METIGTGQGLVSFLTDTLKLTLTDKHKALLNDTNSPYYQYDLLGIFKSTFVEKFFIEADEECPDVQDVISLCRKTGSIAAYAYLGDIGDSVTGDKKTQKFEDDFLDELFPIIKDIGFNAVTYMPSRNSEKQLIRIKSLCAKFHFMEISGEDINSPRQSFICEALKNPAYANLFDATYALIGHEKAATENPENAMFSKKTAAEIPELSDRIKKYTALSGC